MTMGLFAQVNNHQHTFDPGNAREGETVEYCLTHKKQAEVFKNDPAAQQLHEQAQQQLKQYLQNAGPYSSEQKATTYYIPVVFHLVHNNGNEFISDEQILDAFDILNRDYDLQNADAGNVVNAFNASNPSATSIPTDADIQFRLATTAPNGTCFTGITHTVSSASTSGSGSAIYSAAKNGNDVYQGEWPGDEYLNIFIAGDIGGAAGYTYTPSPWAGTGMNNGIWILHNYVGSIGTSSPGVSRALTHEVGHWLNLDHPWGGTNNPGLASNCNDDDGVDDTPDCIGVTSCSLASNTCTGDNGYWGFDQIDQVENYMDYSYCSKMFSPGQVARMRFTLETNQSYYQNRDNLITAANLAATGADGNLYLCKAEFSASKTTVCAGDQVQFTDESFNVVNGWSWTFNGGTPSTSGVQDPVVTYNTPGIYEVTLQSTDGTNSDTETKTGYITVLPASQTLPFLEPFESFTTLNNLLEWTVFNPGNNAQFEITNVGHQSGKSAKLANYGQPAGNIDELESAPVDLSGVTGSVTMSFRYSYRLRTSGNDEWLKVFVTNDCGDSWVQRKTLHGTILDPNVLSTAWTPTMNAADWTTVHMTNVTSAYWVDNFRYKFRFESDGGNNFYLDNINIYLGAPSNDPVGLDEIGSINGIKVYPNPTDNDLNIEFAVSNSQTVVLNVQDVSGKQVMQNLIQANEGSNLVMMDTKELASGVYFLKVQTGNGEETIQFVVK